MVDLVDAVEVGGDEPAFQLDGYEHADRIGEPSDLSIAGSTQKALPLTEDEG